MKRTSSTLSPSSVQTVKGQIHPYSTKKNFATHSSNRNGIKPLGNAFLSDPKTRKSRGECLGNYFALLSDELFIVLLRYPKKISSYSLILSAHWIHFLSFLLQRQIKFVGYFVRLMNCGNGIHSKDMAGNLIGKGVGRILFYKGNHLLHLKSKSRVKNNFQAFLTHFIGFFSDVLYQTWFHLLIHTSSHLNFFKVIFCCRCFFLDNWTRYNREKRCIQPYSRAIHFRIRKTITSSYSNKCNELMASYEKMEHPRSPKESRKCYFSNGMRWA